MAIKKSNTKLSAIKERIRKKREDVRTQEMLGLQDDIRSRVKDAGTNVRKRMVLTKYKDQIKAGGSHEEAMINSAMLLEANANNEGGTTIKQDPAITQAIGEAETSRGILEQSGDVLKKYQKSLFDRWNNDVKDTINVLSDAQRDPAYMEFLGAMGFSPDVVFSLTKGRDSYIESFKNKVRKNFNNDVLYFQDLKNITNEAKRDYDEKTGFLLGERQRIEKQKKEEDRQAKVFERQGQQQNLAVQNSFSSLIKSNPDTFANISIGDLQEMARASGGTIEPQVASWYIQSAKEISAAKDEERAQKQRIFDLEEQKIRGSLAKQALERQKTGFDIQKIKKELAEDPERSQASGSYGKWLEEGRRQGMDESAAEKFATNRVEQTYKDLTEAQGKSFNAYAIMTPENKLYEKISSGVDKEKLADSINILTRKLKSSDDEITAEIVNRNIKDEKIRRVILSELRWIEGSLREKSGAAINVGEYLNEGTANFPRAGDDINTIKDKERARDIATKSKWAKMGLAGQKKWNSEFKQDVTTEIITVKDEARFNQILSEIQKLRGEGVSEDEIKQALLSNGIDPSQFIEE